MASVLITGASRGLGLEFARQYAAAGWRVHATCREPEHASALNAVSGDIAVHTLEVTEKGSLDRLVAELKNAPLDLVIANAGVQGPRGMEIEAIDRDSWMETMAVNTIAPVAVAGALRTNLEKGGQKKVIAISSLLGSIGGNDSGGLFIYRSSKAALNAAWKSLSIEWQPLGMVCVVMHPGWVKTDMGGERAPIEPPQSVAGMIEVIGGLDAGSNGHFYDWTGKELPW